MFHIVVEASNKEFKNLRVLSNIISRLSDNRSPLTPLKKGGVNSPNLRGARGISSIDLQKRNGISLTKLSGEEARVNETDEESPRHEVMGNGKHYLTPNTQIYSEQTNYQLPITRIPRLFSGGESQQFPSDSHPLVAMGVDSRGINQVNHFA